MKVDPEECLGRGEQIIRDHAGDVPRAPLIASLRPATALHPTFVGEEQIAVGASRLGGRPDVPESFVWPRWDGYPGEDRTLPDGTVLKGGCRPAALSFLAQLNLAELEDATGLLPESGSLCFFFDAIQQPWGFDPRDAGAARVVHFDDGARAIRRAVPPDDLPKEGVFSGVFAACRLSASATPTLPKWPNHIGLSLDEAAHDEFDELVDERISGTAPHHRLLGWPKQVQGDMDRECQLVTHGIYCGDAAGYESAQAKELEAGIADWTLLLQLDTDEEGPGWMWGDAGCLFFWIRKQDLAARRFDRVWAILQCY